MSQDKKKTEETFSQKTSMETLEIGYTVYSTRLTNKFRNRPIWVRPDENKIAAFIPGTIQKIFVREGDHLEEGQAILILEAMKMRNEILCPVSGTIRSIHVSEGNHVPKNKLLVEII